jgi:rubrerythrin
MTDAEAVLETVREENETALSRLGSSKSLYAATEGEIDTEPVLRAAADAEHAAWQTFTAWAESEAHEDAREVFEETAGEERTHYEAVSDHLDEKYEPENVPAIHEYLRGLDDTVERVGALLGRILASDRSKSQIVGYFVGNADPQTASLFRAFGDDLDEQRERTGALLEAVCDDDADETRAVEAAGGAIEAAYGEYVESLEELGANPKPVC